MKGHALDLYDAIQRENFDEMGRLVGKTWEQNKALDAGINPLNACARFVDMTLSDKGFQVSRS